MAHLIKYHTDQRLSLQPPPEGGSFTNGKAGLQVSPIPPPRPLLYLLFLLNFFAIARERKKTKNQKQTNKKQQSPIVSNWGS